LGWFQKPRTPRRSEAFTSRFLEAGKAAAPLRHARQLQEYLAGEVVLFALQGGFLVALAFFGRTLVNLFERHGAQLDPWYLRLSLLVLVVCFLLVARRVWARGRNILEARHDLRHARQQLEELREKIQRGEDD
jgi:hypothetical protein